MVLVVGEDQVLAASLIRALGKRAATHVGSVDEAKKVLAEGKVTLLVLIGEAKSFRKLKKRLAEENHHPHTFLILPGNPDPNEVKSGYTLGADMVLIRTDDLTDAILKFA